MKPELDETQLKYLNMNDDELLLCLGNHLFQSGFGSKPVPDAEKRQAAARWFEDTLPEVRKRICGNATLRTQIGPSAANRNAIFAILIDSLAHLGVPAAALAARLINYGIEKLCPEWKV